jgi:hypothetical protein
MAVGINDRPHEVRQLILGSLRGNVVRAFRPALVPQSRPSRYVISASTARCAACATAPALARFRRGGTRLRPSG